MKVRLSTVDKDKKRDSRYCGNVMWMFSCKRRLPVYYRLLPGSIKDVSAFKLCAEDARASGYVAIVDNGFQSRSNMDKLDELKIQYIMPLKRSTAGIDYSVFSSRDNSGADGVFLSQKRPILWSRQSVMRHEVILYLDEIPSR